MKTVWTKEAITNLLFSNEKALYRAIIRIYENQTADEQASGQTLKYNGIGFNGVDAPLMSSFARQLGQRGFLSPKQKSIALRVMPKYHNQIRILIEAKQNNNA